MSVTHECLRTFPVLAHPSLAQGYRAQHQKGMPVLLMPQMEAYGKQAGFSLHPTWPMLSPDLGTFADVISLLQSLQGI